MQSHASRHVVSEFLKDLHPDLSPPFPKEIIKDEIGWAYGRRGIAKLIAVLALEQSELSDEDRAHALRVFNGLLSTQEQKTDAIHENAAPHLITLVGSGSFEVRKLSCQALESLAQVLPGRQAIVAAHGINALTGALETTPEASAGALRQFSASNDGAALLGPYLRSVVPALVTLITSPPGSQAPAEGSGGAPDSGVTLKACENASATLANISTTDPGIVACLEHQVPAAVVGLANRGLSGDFRFEEQLMNLLEACASALEQMAHHPDGKTAVRLAGGIKLLADLLVTCAFQRGPLLVATAGLMAVSIEAESKVPVMINGGVRLVQLLKAGKDEDLVRNARAALASASEHLEARKALGELLDENEQRQLVFCGPLPPTPPDFRYKVILPYTSAHP